MLVQRCEDVPNETLSLSVMHCALDQSCFRTPEIGVYVQNIEHASKHKHATHYDATHLMPAYCLSNCYQLANITLLGQIYLDSIVTSLNFLKIYL